MAKQQKQAAKGGTAKGASLLSKRLKAMKEAWNSAKAESAKMGGDFECKLEPAPDYLGRLSDAKFVGKEMQGFVIELTVIEGDSTGETADIYNDISDPDKLVFLQKNLRRLGVPVDETDIENLENVAKELIERAPTVHFAVVLNPPYKNVYINRLADDDETGSGEATEEEETEEEEAEGEEEEEAEAEEEEAEEEVVEEEEEAEEEAYEPSVGDQVSFTAGGKVCKGEIKKVRSDGKVEVFDPKSKKRYALAADRVEQLAGVASK